jgi:hypothetical protein
VNCTVIQRRLLAAEQPDQPAADIQSHLAECPVCRACQRRLVQLERQIPLLPVPPSTAKAELLHRILGPSTAPAPRPLVGERPNPWRSTLAPGPKERGLRKVSVAFALAATLLIFALGWWAWPHNPPPPHPTISREQRDAKKLEERLAKVFLGETPRERVQRLAALAEEIHGEAREMVDNTERLDQWARFYTRIVGEHLLEQARQVPPEERRQVLADVADRLVGMESKASRLAHQLQTKSPRSATSFDQIAFVAHKGEQDLRALIAV